jgi:hypothetical protein
MYAPRVQEEEQLREEQENHIKEKEANRERRTERERERERHTHTHTHTQTHAKRKGKPKINKILIAIKFRTSLELAREPLTVLAGCFFRKPASPTKSLVSLVSVALLSSLCNDNGGGAHNRSGNRSKRSGYCLLLHGRLVSSILEDSEYRRHLRV